MFRRIPVSDALIYVILMTVMADLYDKLIKLNKELCYPYHMPGHKRNPEAGPLKDTMAIDITEIEGFDDLHDATGILKEAQARAAKLYGAEESFFLVNGGTAGVLAAVCAVCTSDRAQRHGNSGAESGIDPEDAAMRPLLLAGRNSHQSLLHAAYLMDAEVTWLWEEERRERDAVIPGTVDPGKVAEALAAAQERGRMPAAVFVTSPTYYGVIGDTPSIVEIAHSYGVPVIVDEAHGAHLGFGQGMPDSALHAGADLVIDSVHKTLPSLTQTALLHVQGKLIDREKLRRFLRIHQTSSPSYVLMASIDSCLTMIREKPEMLFGGPVLYKQLILETGRDWKYLHLLSRELVQDPCKVVVSTASTHMTGKELYDILLENYHLQPEMAGENEVLFILTGMDTEEGLEALLWSLTAIEGFLADGTFRGEKQKTVFPVTERPERGRGIREAWDGAAVKRPLAECVGEIAAEPVIPYPPGTPLLVPGERIGEDMAARLNALLAAGYHVRGVDRIDGEYRLNVAAG